MLARAAATLRLRVGSPLSACRPAALARDGLHGALWRRHCATAAHAAAAEPSEAAGAAAEVSEAAEGAGESADESEAPPLRFTSDMRPPNNTSRKWVRVDEHGVASAVGRRKKAIANVWVWEVHAKEMAQVRINQMSISRFFGGHWEQRFMTLAPFFETGTAGKYAARATAKGGGLTGQAEAIRLGIATALQGLDASLRPKMKAAGYLKRDPRQRERKKPGQKGARKKFAWVKR